VAQKVVHRHGTRLATRRGSVDGYRKDGVGDGRSRCNTPDGGADEKEEEVKVERKYRSSAIAEGSGDSVLLVLHADQYRTVYEGYRARYAEERYNTILACPVFASWPEEDRRELALQVNLWLCGHRSITIECMTECTESVF